MSKKEKIEVALLGQRFTLRSEQGEEYVNSLARYVNDQVEDIRKATRVVSTHHLAVLAALNVTEELFQARAEIKKQQVDLDRQEKLLEFLKEELQARAEKALAHLDVSMSALGKAKLNTEPAKSSDKTKESREERLQP